MSSAVTYVSVVSYPKDIMTKLQEQQKPGVAHRSEQDKELAMTQCSINQGTEQIGNEGVDTVQKMKQLHNHAVQKPVVI